uniref:Uncharacterized protein n=1 Tax=Elaeophora elaphi TaxID=1147741 RepID=A0A0R3S756_9BILA
MSEIGNEFSNLTCHVIIPSCIYASDVKPNFGFKANLALLKMDSSKLEKWAKVIYEEAEAVTDNDVLAIVRLLRDELIENGKKSPQETQWLWSEQTALLHTLLNTN